MNFYEDLGIAMENLSKRGAFLTVKNKNIVNTMTIAWGYVGYSWNRPFFVAMVRPQRYTQELIKEAKDYTISIPYSDDFKEALTICGTKSGRDIDKEKISKIKFIPSQVVNSPIVYNCDMYYECEIKYVDLIDKDKFPEELKKNYPKEDYHYLYYGEIVKAYKK
ncbi:flavin reductase [Terrisporobacter glycolicus]|uniref:Flavin reductase like domain-containing protein n=1 Tax=Terrisporobacter glycolicus ATCC 14880 = DSM 1288 TaxID=1121315 RepID=A0ABZ2EVW3_9FIRM|nr:flavin reductase [Terrisporobacter glycolicus]